MGRASVGVARKRGLMKRFCATPTEALFVSGGYMPLGKGDAFYIVILFFLFFLFFLSRLGGSVCFG